MMDRNRQLEIHAAAVDDELESITEARIALGTATKREVLGYRHPRIFRKWARANTERDRASREVRRKMKAMSAELRKWADAARLSAGNSESQPTP